MYIRLKIIITTIMLIFTNWKNINIYIKLKIIILFTILYTKNKNNNVQQV